MRQLTTEPSAPFDLRSVLTGAARRPTDIAVFPDDGWEHEASCRSEDPLLFFGPNRFEPKRERIAREAAAKAVCSTCPALDACREQALAEAEPYGVWGGLGEADRRTILHAREGAIARTA